MQLMDTTSTTVIVPEIWSRKFYDAKLAKLPMNDSIDNSYEGEIRDLGDIVNISTVPEFNAAENLAEGAAGAADAVTLTGQQLTINRRIHKDFIVTRKAQLQSLPFMDKVRDMAIYAILKKMQAYLLADVSPSSSSPDHVIAYDSSTTLALADALEVKELLDTANVEEMGRVCILGAAQLNDIFNVAGWSSKDFIGSESPLVSGQIPSSLLGFVPRVTTETGNTSIWFHPSFMTIAIQQALNISVYDLGADGVRAARVNIDLLMGDKQLDNQKVVTLS